MAPARVFPLESIRTDGWFERIGEGIGSFQTLCEVIGARFFAFAMIAGARIVALTVDRRSPENTQVDFVVASDERELEDVATQRLSIGDFRRRLVNALSVDDTPGPAPTRATDQEAVQKHIGVRYLLLAPIFGYSLNSLNVDSFGSMLTLRRDGIEELYELEEFRSRIRLHVREELQRAERGGQRGSIDLAKVDEAEQAASGGDHHRVLELLGSWPAPLAVFLRTVEGQSLQREARVRIARALALLGSACIGLGEIDRGQEILRLAVQYAGDTPEAADVYTRLGRSMMVTRRFGEAIAPLRRAANLGADGRVIWPLLATAFAERSWWLAALAAIDEARESGAEEQELALLSARCEQNLGPELEAFRKLVEP